MGHLSEVEIANASETHVETVGVLTCATLYTIQLFNTMDVMDKLYLSPEFCRTPDGNREYFPNL